MAQHENPMNPLPRNNHPQQSSHLSQYTRQKMHNPEVPAADRHPIHWGLTTRSRQAIQQVAIAAIIAPP
jgi:hypothetical protein